MSGSIWWHCNLIDAICMYVSMSFQFWQLNRQGQLRYMLPHWLPSYSTSEAVPVSFPLVNNSTPLPLGPLHHCKTTPYLAFSHALPPSHAYITQTHKHTKNVSNMPLSYLKGLAEHLTFVQYKQWSWHMSLYYITHLNVLYNSYYCSTSLLWYRFLFLFITLLYILQYSVLSAS